MQPREGSSGAVTALAWKQESRVTRSGVSVPRSVGGTEKRIGPPIGFQRDARNGFRFHAKAEVPEAHPYGTSARSHTDSGGPARSPGGDLPWEAAPLTLRARWAFRQSARAARRGGGGW